MNETSPKLFDYLSFHLSILSFLFPLVFLTWCIGGSVNVSICCNNASLCVSVLRLLLQQFLHLCSFFFNGTTVVENCRSTFRSDSDIPSISKILPHRTASGNPMKMFCSPITKMMKKKLRRDYTSIHPPQSSLVSLFFLFYLLTFLFYALSLSFSR